MKGDWGCLYADEGSAFITWQNNVCDTAPGWLSVQGPLLINNWTTSVHNIHVPNDYTNVQPMRKGNADVINTAYSNGQNWSSEAQAIIKNAGLEAAYSYLHEWLNK